MSKYQTLLFYKYVHIDNPKALMKEQKALQESLGLKGRTLIASEGINATLEGLTKNTEEYLNHFLSDERFKDTHIKRSESNGDGFPKCMVKVRSEIVTLGLGACDIDPNKITGKRLKPDELHEWLKDGKEFYMVDMRNAYEHDIGRFEGSICPPMDNFRDLPKFIKSLEHLKDKTVLTVCTGGVRCEKASGYLISQGFSDVYQLDGGIVSYMEKYPNENFLGKLYVFDNRIAMGFYTDDPKHKVIGKCVICNEACERFTNCFDINCHRQLIAHEACEKELGEKFRCPQGCKEKTRVN
jgi:UPF0176 protein